MYPRFFPRLLSWELGYGYQQAETRSALPWMDGTIVQPRLERSLSRGLRGLPTTFSLHLHTSYSTYPPTDRRALPRYVGMLLPLPRSTPWHKPASHLVLHPRVSSACCPLGAHGYPHSGYVPTSRAYLLHPRVVESRQWPTLVHLTPCQSRGNKSIHPSSSSVEGERTGSQLSSLRRSFGDRIRRRLTELALLSLS